jgi:hypothetical protein
MNDDKQKQRHAKWRNILDEYQVSNQTQKSFCEQRNISLPQFVYYRSLFKQEEKSQAMAGGFVPLKLQQSDKSASSSEIKLSLPNGFQCAFPSHVDATQIKRLIEVLLSC